MGNCQTQDITPEPAKPEPAKPEPAKPEPAKLEPAIIDDLSFGSVTKFNPKTDFFNAYAHDIYDGDTVWFRVRREDLIQEPTVLISGRILGVDTPEMKGAGVTQAEKDAAKLAKEAVQTLMANKTIQIKLNGNDKYGGRFLTHVLVDGVSLAGILVTSGHARAYYGDKKIPFEEWYDVKKLRDVMTVYNELKALQ